MQKINGIEKRIEKRIEKVNPYGRVEIWTIGIFSQVLSAFWRFVQVSIYTKEKRVKEK